MCTPRNMTDYGEKTAPNRTLPWPAKGLTSTETLGSNGPTWVHMECLVAHCMAALNHSQNLRLEQWETSWWSIRIRWELSKIKWGKGEGRKDCEKESIMRDKEVVVWEGSWSVSRKLKCEKECRGWVPKWNVWGKGEKYPEGSEVRTGWCKVSSSFENFMFYVCITFILALLQLKIYFSLHAYSELWLLPYGYTDRQRPDNFEEIYNVSLIGVEALRNSSGHE